MLLLKGHGFNKTIYALAFAPDGTELASVGNDDRLRLWDLSTGKETASHPAHYFTRSVCYSVANRPLIWSSFEGVMTLTSEKAEAEIAVPSPQGVQYVRQAFYSPDQTRLYCNGKTYRPDQGNTSCVEWDLVADQGRSWPNTDGLTEWGLALAPSGRTLATAHQIRPAKRSRSAGKRNEHPVRLWDIATRQVTTTLTGHTSEIVGLAFSPDSRFLAVASGATLWVWDVTTATVVAQHRYGKEYFKSVAFSPEGRWLLTARNDATARFYDTQTWSEGPTFDWDIGPLVKVAFAADGMRAAAGSSKGKIIVWDVDL